MNSDEFGAKVEEAMPRLYRYARRLTFDDHDADDILQDALIKAYRNLDHLTGDPAHYVVCAVYTAYIDLTRRRTKRPETTLEYEPVKFDDDLIKLLLRKELGERIEKAARNVSERCRQIMYDFADDLTQEQVALKNNVAVGTVKSTLHRTRKTLQQILGEFNELAI